MNNIFFALFAVLTLFISMVGGLLPQRLRTYQYMCLFMEILSCYIFFSPLGQPSTYIVLFCSLMLITLFRSVYKELHADHETGAADNK